MKPVHNAARFENWQGMNWIRKEKRLAIYLRDDLRCVYCGSSKSQLTLDHLIINADHSEKNLVTCCMGCNSSRANQNWQRFAEKPAVIVRILKRVNLPLDVERAKQLLARRGGDWRATLSSLKRSS